MPTLLEIAGERDPVARWPWLRGVSLVPALEDPDARGPRDSILYRIDEYPITNVGTAVPTAQPHPPIYDGRYKFARYVAVAEQHFAGEELRRRARSTSSTTPGTTRTRSATSPTTPATRRSPRTCSPG